MYLAIFYRHVFLFILIFSVLSVLYSGILPHHQHSFSPECWASSPHACHPITAQLCPSKKPPTGHTSASKPRPQLLKSTGWESCKVSYIFKHFDFMNIHTFLFPNPYIINIYIYIPDIFSYCWKIVFILYVAFLIKYLSNLSF